MAFETISEKITSGEHYSVRRINDNGLQIAEVYDTRQNNLDFVAMYFSVDSENRQKIETKIKQYRNNENTSIIGCGNSVDEMADLFDVYLNDATESDFENMIDFCISTEEPTVHVSQRDFESQPGTKVFLVAEKSNSVEKLIENLKASSQKLLDHIPAPKFPKVVVSIMTNGCDFLLSDTKKFFDSITDYLTDDPQCMWNLCECMPGLKDDEIKVMLIFFEKDNY